MRTTANATPATATRSRTFSRRSWSQARRPAEITTAEPPSLRRDRDLDLEVRERRGAGAVVEPDPHLDDAGVGPRRRIRGEEIELPDLETDTLDGAGEILLERRRVHG